MAVLDGGYAEGQILPLRNGPGAPKDEEASKDLYDYESDSDIEDWDEESGSQGEEQRAPGSGVGPSSSTVQESKEVCRQNEHNTSF